VYDAIKGTFASKKVGKVEHVLLEEAAFVLAPALGGTMFECLQQILVTMTKQLLVAIPSLLSAGVSVSPSSTAVHAEVTDVEVSLFEAYLTATKHLYETWVSAKGLFFIDKGRLSLYLAEALVLVIKQAFRCSFHAQREQGREQEQGGGSTGGKPKDLE
jgi:hypothetical protein